jgi:hypothetical protein
VNHGKVTATTKYRALCKYECHLQRTTREHNHNRYTIDSRAKMSSPSEKNTFTNKKEKAKFFRDLEALDDVSEDEHESAVSPEKSRPARSTINTKIAPAKPESKPAVKDDAVKPRKRKASQETLNKCQASISSKPIPKLLRAATLPETSTTRSKPPTLKKTMTAPAPSLRYAHTTQLNLEARLNGNDKLKLRRIKTKWLEKQCKRKPTQEQLLEGIVFCMLPPASTPGHSIADLVIVLVPNNDDDERVRQQIRNAIMDGATWAHDFCDDVTHVLVTRDNINAAIAAKSFPDKKLPVSGILRALSRCTDACIARDTYH